MAINKISIVGSGNVAEALGGFLKKAGLNIVEVHSRNQETGTKLAMQLDANFRTNIKELKFHSGLFLLAVPDDVIKNIAGNLPSGIQAKAKIVHCSGSTPSTVLKKACANYGVFYPLQTFSKGRKISGKKIPFCITASNTRLGNSLFKLAKQISSAVQFITDQERKQLHLGAVMVNNFTNHLLSLSANFVEQKGLSFELLVPLIQETVKKALANDPRNSQTGPAKRDDQKTIERHLKLLKTDPKLAALYKQFSENISDYYKA